MITAATIIAIFVRREAVGRFVSLSVMDGIGEVRVTCRSTPPQVGEAALGLTLLKRASYTPLH